MSDLIKQVPLVKVAAVRKSDLGQIDHCIGLRMDEDTGEFFQREAGGDRRELVVIGWLKGLAHLGDNLILVQRDDGRLLKQGLLYEQSKLVTERYPQIFVR